MRSGRYARPRMEAAISCKFHCKRLEGHWEGYWPATDPAALTEDIEQRRAAATAAWGARGHPIARRGCGGPDLRRDAARPAGGAQAEPPAGHSDDVQLAAEGDALAFWRATGAAADLLDLHAGNALRAG